MVPTIYVSPPEHLLVCGVPLLIIFNFILKKTLYAIFFIEDILARLKIKKHK